MNEFREQFDIVFDKEFHVKNCGRDNTIKLIKLATSCKSEVNFGDSSTDFMNIPNIIDLYLGVA
jgi:hypothetical protein